MTKGKEIVPNQTAKSLKSLKSQTPHRSKAALAPMCAQGNSMLVWNTFFKSGFLTSTLGCAAVATFSFPGAMEDVLSWVFAPGFIAFGVAFSIFIVINIINHFTYDETVPEAYGIEVDSLVRRGMGKSRYEQNNFIWTKKPRYIDSWNPIRLVRPITMGQACEYDAESGSYKMVSLTGSAFHTKLQINEYLTDRGVFNETLKKLEANRKSEK